LEDTGSVKKGETRTLWTIARDTFLHDQYNFTQYTKSLNDYDQEMEAILLPTDSRRRLDRHFLEKGETDSATYWKKVMEERQRQDRKTRRDTWHPVWFKKVDQSDILGEGKSMWVYTSDYWEQRTRKLDNFKDGKDVSTLLRPPQVAGLACDFTSYATVPSDLPPAPGSVAPIPPVQTESDTINDQDTTTDTTTDTGTITTTDDDLKDDDTDTETELEGWAPPVSGSVPAPVPVAVVDGAVQVLV